jgi:hypothetical protein
VAAKKYGGLSDLALRIIDKFGPFGSSDSGPNDELSGLFIPRSWPMLSRNWAS